MEKKQTYTLFHRTIAALLVMILFFSDFPVAAYANGTGTSVNETVCGLEEHVHTEECYEAQETLICGMTAGEGATLQCGLEESESHTHDASCYAEDGHAHSEACYQTNNKLVCEKEEHQHSEQCDSTPDTNPKPLNTTPEAEDPTPEAEDPTPEAENPTPETPAPTPETPAPTPETPAPTPETPDPESEPQAEGDPVGGNGETIINADTSWEVNADTTYETLTVNDNIQLTINVATGVTLTLGNVTGNGTLILTGSGTVAVTSEIKVGTLEITGVTINGGRAASVSALNSLTLHSGTIQNLALFGYADSATGPRMLVLKSGNFQDVAALGVTETNPGVVLSITGLTAVTLSNTNVYQDYSVSYQHNDVSISGAGWLQSYRVKTTDGTENPTTVSIRTLPEYKLKGYTFSGWKLQGGAAPIFELPESGLAENIVLIAQMQARQAEVTFDLGFEPTDLTNDRDEGGKLPTQTTTQTSSVDAKLDLPTPQRFGYVFQGWKITTGDDPRVISKETSSITISSSDLAESDGGYTVNLVAQWKLDEFSIRLQPTNGFGSNFSNLEISVDGGTNWYSFEDLAVENKNMTLEGDNCNFSLQIEYQETLGNYFKRVFGQDSSYPILRDTRAVDSGKQRFVSWKTTEGKTLQADSKYEYGNEGFLTKPSDKTLSAYQSDLKGNPVVLGTIWSNTFEYTLTVPVPMPTGWSIVVNDQEKTPDENGVISVDDGKEVYFRIAKNASQSITAWTFTTNQGTQYLYPALEPVGSADAFLYYGFTMPSSDVTASYHEGTVYVDIAQSDILFAENIEYNGLTGLTGFWYSQRMEKKSFDDMTVNAMTPLFFTTDTGDSSAYAAVTDSQSAGWYFYQFDWANKPFYVTSCNKETKNQLKIINAATVYLKDCNLAFRQEYLDECVGTTFNGVDMVTVDLSDAHKALSLSSYGNIVIDLQQNKKYNTTIYIQGRNTVGVITTDKLYSGSAYRGRIYLRGTGVAESELTLGTFITSTFYFIMDMTVHAITESPSDYLVYCCAGGYWSAGYAELTNLRIHAPEKMIHSTTYPTAFTNCQDSEIGNGYFPRCSFKKNSNMRVRGDIRCNVYMIGITESTLVVDGNLIFGGGAYNGTSTLNNGTLIVKGTVCELYDATITGNSTVIANIVSVSCRFDFSGNSRIITNMLTSRIQQNATWDPSTKRWKLNDVTARDATAMNMHGNGEPFLTSTYSAYYPAGNPNDHFFEGDSKTFLFGFYRTKPIDKGKIYDLSTTPQTPGNPIAGVISLWEEKGTVSDDEVLALLHKAEQGYQSSGQSVECVSFGFTTIPAQVNQQKFVQINGNAEVYAAGNLTFFNHTTVNGGKVECGGTFSTKRDLTVTGGSITATEIGNLYHLTMDVDSAGTVKRWQKASFANCNLTTNRIGALTKQIESTDARSTVSFGDNVNVQPRSPGNVTVVSDTYVNYVYDDTQFELDAAQLPENLRFTASNLQGTAVMTGLRLPAQQTFANPKIIGSTETGSWRYNSLDNYTIQSVGIDGRIDDDPAKDCVYEAEQLSLYAVKDNYTLWIREGSEFISQVSAGGDPVTGTKQYSVKAKLPVTITLNSPAMVEKTVVWYADASGVIHNVEKFGRNGNQITFTMPTNDAEVFITQELAIYLDLSDISFTSDGFALEAPGEDRRPDSVFQYAGNLLVTETTPSAETYNNLYFESADAGNVRADGTLKRTITLKGIKQACTGEEMGTTIADGAKVEMCLDGKNYLKRILNPEHSEVTVTGKSGPESDKLFLAKSSTYIIYSDGKLGKSTLKDVTFGGSLGNNYGIRIFTSMQNTDALVTLKNVRGPDEWNNKSYTSHVANKVNNISIIDSEIHFRSYDYVFFADCKNLRIENSVLDYVYGKGFAGQNLFRGISDITEIIDSEVSLRLVSSTSNNIEVLSQKENVVVSGNSTFTVDHRLMLKSLTVQDNATVTIGTDGAEGYLLCADVVVKDSAVLNTGYLFVSGFNNASYVSNAQLLAGMAAGKYIVNGASYRGLILNGGTVNASAFVGGDVNGKITVNAGTLNAPRIGTLGKLCGYSTMIPQEGEEYAVFLDRVPVGAAVNINGGTVNVTPSGATQNGYLGGMKANVNITGGTVNLGDGMVLGMTDDQKTTLANDYSSSGSNIADHKATNINVTITGGSVSGDNGQISAPYGTISISEAAGSNTQVSVLDCMAESGDISISNANDGFANLYSGGEEDVSKSVGVLVNRTLSAQNLRILHGASVYAKKAYSIAEAGQSGVLDITQDETSAASHTALYTGEFYGTMSNGSVGDTVHNAATDIYRQNVYGSRRVSIQYELNDDAEDPAVNNANPDGFVVGSYSENGNLIHLQDPTRFGYDFGGWYQEADYSGNKVTQILTTNNQDLVLYAKWTPRMIPFSINVTRDKVTNLDTEILGLPGTLNGDTFTFTNVVEVPYGSVIIGTDNTPNQVHLVNYNLATVSVTGLVWNHVVNENPVFTPIESGITKVDKDMVNAYDNGGTLTLYIDAISTRLLNVTMDLNLKNGLPKDAEFNYQSNPNVADGTTISSYVDFGKTYGDAAGFASGGQLIKPTAPGYTFQGWYTQKDGSGQPVTADMVISKDSPDKLYAIWEANTYQIRFDAGVGNVVTLEDTAPAESVATQTLLGTVVYDQKINGTIHYADSATGTLPYAWKKGYVFLGWSYDNTQSVKINSDTVLNLDNIPQSYLDVDNVYKNDGSNTPALTLHAVYRKIQVTYHPNGGTWQGSQYGTGQAVFEVDAPEYGEALAGYVKNAQSSNANYDLTGTVESGGITYAAYSTTKDGYNARHDYVDGDYRNTILRKGYTFFGWYPTKANAESVVAGADFFPTTYDNAVGTVPEYADIELYAAWKPNEYSLTLHAYDSTRNYSNTEFKQDGVLNGQTIPLKIADEVLGNYITAGNIKWPAHSQWYAYKTDGLDPETNEDARRYLVGFTFDPLDPGDANYAESVTKLVQKDALFYKEEGSTAGTIFHLPEDPNYGASVITGTNTVPDYPNGYTIPLYAVYRERSLVFMEYYVKADGSISRMMLHAAPYHVYSNYPTGYKPSSVLTTAGYKLLKWGVNGFGIDAEEYPSDAALYTKEKVNEYKNKAEELGTFDIHVYTVYAAQVTDESIKSLTATENTQAAGSYVQTYTCKLPNSMQTGVIKYELLANDGTEYNGFELVPSADMIDNRYDPDYSNKIALTMEIRDASNKVVVPETDLKSNVGQVLLSSTSIGAGNSIWLHMYHSAVMTVDETKTISLKCNFYRDATESGQDMHQFFWLKNIHTTLTPSMYTVSYDVDLPDDANRLVTENDGFTINGNKATKTVETAYGSALAVPPAVEGYTQDDTWTRTKQDGSSYSESDNTVAYGANLMLPVSAADNGNIYLHSSYTVNQYDLKLSQDVLNKWTVTVDGIQVTTSLWSRLVRALSASAQDDTTVPVEYHQTVTFTGITAGEPAEFIRLALTGSSSELDLYATPGEGNTYTFLMPASNVDASYQDVRTLYLEDGSIALSADGYQQNGHDFRTWRGGYEILMNAANNDTTSTDNRLTISGDLSGRSIQLGKLNIAADNAIELYADAEVTLQASKIQAKNILVPSGASLTMECSDANRAEITLAPDVGYAAIGGHNGANGTIVLNNLSLSMALPTGSSASGIGAGSRDDLTGCGNVSLTGCSVVVTETFDASSAYQGSWIGGTGVPNVTITDSTIAKGTGSKIMTGPYVLKGKSVTVSGCSIGTSVAPVNDPIYASDTLTFTNSTTVYQSIESPLSGIAAIGTGDSGTIKVENESTISAKFTGSGSSDKLYTGKLQICDGASHVVIKGIQLMDVNNGLIQIAETGSTQSGTSHGHTGSYLLLSAFNSYDGTCDLTVNGLTGGAKVQTNAMTLRNLTVNSNTSMQLNGNLELTGTTKIESEKTLTVAAGANTITVKSFNGKGNYHQTGGNLTGTNNLIVGGDLTLDGVTATLAGKNLGSSGAAGVTTVTIQDSAVTAAKVGALGVLTPGLSTNPFTFVKLNGTNNITGNLIQDHYRITYALPNANYKADDLPTVLRSTTVYNSSAGDPTYEPSIPAAPKYTPTFGTSQFKNWYVILNGTNVALSENPVSGFTQHTSLGLTDFLSNAEDTVPIDGTKTLTLRAWMGLEGKATIQSGRNLADMGAIADTSPFSTSVINNGQWTARFEIQGTVIAGSKYQFVFTNAIPEGTKLTLCDRSGETLKWYYYIAEADVSSVYSDAFVAMGSTNKADLPGGNEGERLTNRLQLTADFSGASSPAIGNTVTMNLVGTNEKLEIPGISLTYTVDSAATASIAATESNVTVAVTRGNDTRLDGKTLYAVAVINGAAGSIPYGATVTCDDRTGTWLGGNTIAFDLGNYAALNATTYNWRISGLLAGDYSVTWYLTAANDLKNPFDCILATTASVQIHRDVVEPPRMTAVLTHVDEAAPTGQVLTAGTAHTVRFAVETNQTEVKYSVEKQTALKKFTTIKTSAESITIPAEAGVYRVRISINDNSEWDDVYYSFIVR